MLVRNSSTYTFLDKLQGSVVPSPGSEGEAMASISGGTVNSRSWPLGDSDKC